jgi:hypothetical protein
VTAQVSQTGIVNKALVMLGTARTITSLGDATPLARTAAALWDPTRDEVLADHPWNFAIRRAALAVSADYVPPNEYSYAYELPGDCLRWLPWQEDHEDAFAGEEESGDNGIRYILSSATAPIYVRYIARVEDVARWSPGFVEAFAAKLARALAKPVTGQAAMIDRMEGLYQEALSGAKRQDGLATGRRQRDASFRSNWLSARGRTFGGVRWR